MHNVHNVHMHIQSENRLKLEETQCMCKNRIALFQLFHFVSLQVSYSEFKRFM